MKKIKDFIQKVWKKLTSIESTNLIYFVIGLVFCELIACIIYDISHSPYGAAIGSFVFTVACIIAKELFEKHYSYFPVSKRNILDVSLGALLGAFILLVVTL